jgi:Domain of unknown function (DUF4114)/PEP-CTERM motif
MSFKKIVLGLALLTITSGAAAAQPRAYNLIPSTDKLFVATAGEVILTFLSKEAAYSNDLYLQGTANAILNNQSAVAGSQYSLGSFQAGAELVFSMLVNNTGLTYFTGKANKNPDSFIHAAYDITSRQSLNIGFEDIFNGGDRDYNDLVFSLTNVGLGPSVSAVPEPEVLGMLTIGLMLLGFVARRKS